MNVWHAKSIETIIALRCCKQDLFTDYPHAFDFAMPQSWLTHFAEWCKAHRPAVEYDTIRSTTVWEYPKGKMDGPVTVCREVYFAWCEYDIAIN